MVIPNAVGVDIGCGMKARKTNLTEVDPQTLRKILGQIQEDIPTGFAHQSKPRPLSQTLLELTRSFKSSNPRIEEIVKEMPNQLGTLGGGNHFIELQLGDDGHIWIMLHSGSRGIGKMTCDYYNDIAVKLNHKWYSYEAPDLAFLPMDDQYGKEYLEAMRIAMQFAEDNRLLMLEKVTQAIMKFIPNLTVEEAIDTHHNYAALENHGKKDVLVHRKGAVKARGKVIIPGSMGTHSYIAEGLENPESFSSCSHGAGRVMGRKEAMRQFSMEQVTQEMADKGIVLFKIQMADVAEECAEAYKDIDTVMENQKDLVKPLVKLRPIGVVKG